MSEPGDKTAAVPGSLSPDNDDMRDTREFFDSLDRDEWDREAESLRWLSTPLGSEGLW